MHKRNLHKLLALLLILFLIQFSEGISCSFCGRDYCRDQSQCCAGKSPKEGNIRGIPSLVLGENPAKFKELADYSAIHENLSRAVLVSTANIYKLRDSKGSKADSKKGEQEETDSGLQNVCAVAFTFYFKALQPDETFKEESSSVDVKWKHVREFIKTISPKEPDSEKSIKSMMDILAGGAPLKSEEEPFPFISGNPSNNNDKLGLNFKSEEATKLGLEQLRCKTVGELNENYNNLFQKYYSFPHFLVEGPQFKKSSPGRTHSEDSERFAFWLLDQQCVLEALIQDAGLTNLSPGSQFVGVVMHLHSFRDMCTGCLTYENILVHSAKGTLAGVPNKEGCLARLIRLITEKMPMAADQFVTSVVSSNVRYSDKVWQPSKESHNTKVKGNARLFNVNQYRFSQADLLAQLGELSGDPTRQKTINSFLKNYVGKEGDKLFVDPAVLVSKTAFVPTPAALAGATAAMGSALAAVNASAESTPSSAPVGLDSEKYVKSMMSVLAEKAPEELFSFMNGRPEENDDKLMLNLKSKEATKLVERLPYKTVGKKSELAKKYNPFFQEHYLFSIPEITTPFFKDCGEKERDKLFGDPAILASKATSVPLTAASAEAATTVSGAAVPSASTGGTPSSALPPSAPRATPPLSTIPFTLVTLSSLAGGEGVTSSAASPDAEHPLVVVASATSSISSSRAFSTFPWSYDTEGTILTAPW